MSDSDAELAGDEERIVQHYLRALTQGVPEALGLVDDCALVRPEPGYDLVFKTDAVVAGTHFFADDAPADIAFKALAVNVSDLIAKAATPRFWQMTLALPEAPKARWLEQVCDGFAQVQALSGIRLIGGDLVKTKGPLVISITAVGVVPTGMMRLRSGGGVGDDIYVSGTIGDAALGLALRADDLAARQWPLDPAQRRALVDRYLRPQLRMALIEPLRRHARAAMDVSDGLVIDFHRLCRAAGCGGVLQADAMPLSPAARHCIDAKPELLAAALTGGDDYEVLAAIDPKLGQMFETSARQNGVVVTKVGQLSASPIIRVLDGNGRAINAGAGGYLHF